MNPSNVIVKGSHSLVVQAGDTFKSFLLQLFPDHVVRKSIKPFFGPRKVSTDGLISTHWPEGETKEQELTWPLGMNIFSQTLTDKTVNIHWIKITFTQMSIKRFCSFCVTSCFALRSFLRFSSFIISSKYREAALEKLQEQCLSKDTFFPWAVTRYRTNRSKN